MTSSLLLLIAGLVLMAITLVLVLKPWWVAAVPAYVGLWCLHWSSYTSFPRWVFIFYGGNLYLGLGAMMGCLLGMIVEARFMVLGTILGTVMGQLAFSRTPGGK